MTAIDPSHREGKIPNPGFRSGASKQLCEKVWTLPERLMRYAIVIENAGGNFSAYVPDLPGCVATGRSVPETEQEIRDAIRFHLDGLREDGVPIPAPSAVCEYVEL